MGVYNYNKSTELLTNMPRNVSKEFSNNIREMQRMSLYSLQTTRQGHLVQAEDERVHSPPRYDFRNLEPRQQPPSSEQTEEPESSRPRKTKKSRARG